jgi:polynucleotide 5'-hydroxyl-kinase GRC3/NOL9
VRYSGPENKRGFLGLLCYDHQPAPELLAEAINGTVLALVKLESRAALRDLLLPLPSSSQSHNPQPPTTSAGEEDDAIVAPTSSSKVNVRAAAGHTHPLPLIPNPLGRTLDPRHSRLLGLVLVRGVDVARGELQLVTPLPAEHIATVPGQELVLVAGRFDTPTWAYAEDLYSRRAAAKGQRKGVSGSGGDDDDEDEDEDGDGDGDEDEEGEGGKVVQERWSEVPWVEMLHGSQKKAVGSKVWRVRRDLGRG